MNKNKKIHKFQQFNIMKECRYGTLLFNRNDTYIGKSLDLYGEYCEGEVELFNKVINPGDVIFDIGANIGTHTTFFARITGSKGFVLAFEPQRIIFQNLCANMSINSITNAHCYNYALADINGTVFIPNLDYTKENNFGALRADKYDQGEQVMKTTIDNFCIDRCDFIKIDVEDMTLAVIKGGVNTIKKHQPILYMENNPGEQQKEVIDFMKKQNYNLYWHVTPYYNENNFFKNKKNVFKKNNSQYTAHNMLCLPKNYKQIAEIQDISPI